MKTPIKSFKIIKEMYGYFVKKYRDLEPDLMICEQKDFDNVEKALKDYEELLKIEYKQNTINDFYPNTKAMIDDLLNLVCTKMSDALKDGKSYTKAGILETLGFAIRYVKTFAYGSEFNETEKVGVNAKKLKALEIIKEKRADVGWLISCENIEQYNNVVGTATHKLLTQEEYDLLKEVLK